jgi:hypothetical protein
MMNATVLRIGLAMPLLLVSVLAAAQPQQAPAAPVPARILTAKKVFVVNAGADGGAYSIAPFSGEPERAYNSFYAAMKTWGHYQLVGAPSDADLLIEIRLTVSPPEVLSGQSLSWGDAQFRLVIRDPKTQAMLWAMTEQVENAGLLRNRDKNFDQALAKLVARLERLTAPSTTGGSNPQ